MNVTNKITAGGAGTLLLFPIDLMGLVRIQIVQRTDVARQTSSTLTQEASGTVARYFRLTQRTVKPVERILRLTHGAAKPVERIFALDLKSRQTG